MAENIAALYENGVLRPLSPLKLRENQTVYIQILETEPDVDRTEIAIQNLVAKGILTLPPGYSDIAPPTEAERLALAEELSRAPGKSISEIILEDRGPL
jgi:predicted DNA-binding antitoxin AbrB/MazE fold protein